MKSKRTRVLVTLFLLMIVAMLPVLAASADTGHTYDPEALIGNAACILGDDFTVNGNIADMSIHAG